MNAPVVVEQLVEQYGSWVIGAAGIIVLIAAGRKRRWAWLFGACIAEPLWLAYAALTRQWGLVPACLAYMTVHLHNWRRWRSG